MAGARGRLHKSASATPSATPRRSARRGAAAQDNTNVPAVFQEMLAESTPSMAAGPDEDSKPLKKRRTAASAQPRRLNTTTESAERTRVPSKSATQTVKEPVKEPPKQPSPPASPSSPSESEWEDVASRTRQTIQDSDESDGSDSEWEDALGNGNDNEGHENEGNDEPEIGDVTITIGGDKLEAQRKRVKRRGITSVEKKHRLYIHKMHILCLLYHVHRRNAWCNDGKVQATLRKIISPKVLANLVPNPELSQFQASKRFVDGIRGLKMFWSSRFSVTAKGMHKPRWPESEEDAQPFSAFEEYDMIMDKEDFRKAATSLQGSQDVGAQLLCALLRAIGVEARLVCSLQCLPFASSAQPPAHQKHTPTKNAIHLDPYNKQEASASSSKSPVPETKYKPLKLARKSRLENILGERHPALHSGAAPKPKKKYETAYPVYWIEVLNPAYQKWIPVDVFSTFTVDKPEKLEPPLNDPKNSLCYAVAFEEDYTAKDVTRRYAKAYNAKTRKLRVESTDGGAKWWRRALKPFRRREPLDRDQVEDAALARKEGAEGMPKNVQDFKDHPIYVLERHLRHNEVIHPMHQVGKVNVASAMNPKIEPIYRRENVHIVRSADKWYRMGRDVKDGEQPLKHAKPKKNARRSVGPDEEDYQDEEVGVGLYAEFQTELYTPPPVVGGRVPRNAYGNLDLYVPSMVPPGGVHIRHKLAAKAARILGIDSADAVTGFSFKGRHGTAVVQGVVVAQEYKEAVEAVIDAMEYAVEEAEKSQRSAEALRMWRRFCLGLRIAKRVNAIVIEGERGPEWDVQGEIEKEDRRITEEQMAGGFFLDERGNDELEMGPRPKRRLVQEHEYLDAEDPQAGGGGFFPDEPPVDDGFGGGFVPEEERGHDDMQVDGAADDFEGGFISEEESTREATDDFGGGFIPEEQTAKNTTNDLGGGFITEDTPMDSTTDDIGGGFIPEDDPMETTTDNLGGGFISENEPTETTAHNSGGGFIPEDDPMDSTESHATEQIKSGPAGPIVRKVPPSDGGGEPQTEAENAAEVQPSPIKAPSEVRSETPSEAGSLPLEDPDDEDAEPDWLVDVT